MAYTPIPGSPEALVQEWLKEAESAPFNFMDGGPAPVLKRCARQLAESLAPALVAHQRALTDLEAIIVQQREQLKALALEGAHKQALHAVAAWFKEMDDPPGPIDVKSGTPADIKGHLQKVEQLRNAAKAAVQAVLHGDTSYV